MSDLAEHCPRGSASVAEQQPNRNISRKARKDRKETK